MPSISPNPTRFPGGLSTDFVWGPMADFPLPNPLDVNTWMDDFSSYQAGFYTVTASGNGTVAQTAGDGGLALFTTNSSTPNANDIVSIQLKAAAFTPVLGKKMFFGTRLQLSSATNAAFLCGFIQTTTTPFTVVDGLYFSKATGSLTNLTGKAAASSTITTGTVPTNTYTLANATNIDLAIYVDKYQNVKFYCGNLFGFTPQSGIGSAVSPRGWQLVVGPPTFPTANLNPTIAIQSGTAASSTMTVDFMFAAKER